MNAFRYILIVATLLLISCDEKVIPLPAVDTENIEIIRDSYGVPHIFSKTDKEAIYGIAWAQCEDNFNLMQEKLIILKGMSGRVNGADGAKLDYIIQLFEIDQFIADRYEQDITPEIDGFLDSYASAVNRYAGLHPEEVELKRLFPITKHDLLKGGVINFMFLTNAFTEVAKIASDRIDLYKEEGNFMGAGSNAFAYSSNASSTGKTYLVGNPHQPIIGSASFWELSVHSEEGMDMFGATLAGGGLVPALGTNKNLGWSSTTNYEDYVDVYQLEMHPFKKNHYKYDGEWISLEEKVAKLKVKLGPIVIPKSESYYTSQYGPTMKTDSGYFSFRSNCFFNLKMTEQYYKMGKSRNFEEFWDALQLNGIPSQTFDYADREGNVMHMNNAVMPVRNKKYEWRKLLPGNTADTKWSFDQPYPVDSLVYVKNPTCGYIFTCNNNPTVCTAIEDQPKLENFPSSFGILSSNNVRSNRLGHLLASEENIDYEVVKRIRNDLYVDKLDMTARHFMNAKDMHIVLNKYPTLLPSKKVIDKWNGQFTIDNKHAGIVSLISVYITQYITDNFAIYDTSIPEEVIVEVFTKAQDFLMKHHGTLEVPLGDIQRIIRGDKDYPMYGGPNTLANAHFKINENGKLQCIKGDSYIFYAQYGDDGLERLETINVFGNSNKPDSPHFSDQLDIYKDMGTKKVNISRESIRASGTGYHPE